MAVTLRDLLAALQHAPRISSVTADRSLPARWSEPVQALPVDAATLIEALDWHARTHPDRVQIVYLGDSGETNISHGDRQRQVDIVATGLQRAGLEPRQTAAIMLPTSPVLPPSSAPDAFAASAALRDGARAHALAHCGEPDAGSG